MAARIALTIQKARQPLGPHNSGRDRHQEVRRGVHALVDRHTLELDLSPANEGKVVDAEAQEERAGTEEAQVCGPDSKSIEADESHEEEDEQAIERRAFEVGLVRRLDEARDTELSGKHACDRRRGVQGHGKPFVREPAEGLANNLRHDEGHGVARDEGSEETAKGAEDAERCGFEGSEVSERAEGASV